MSTIMYDEENRHVFERMEVGAFGGVRVTGARRCTLGNSANAGICPRHHRRPAAA